MYLYVFIAMDINTVSEPSSATSAAIFILTQNTIARKVHLKNCLYFLFRNFNATYQYPVLIFHEGDYKVEDQREIIMSIRASCRSLVSFQTLDPADFSLPAHIDAVKAQRCVELKVTPYWRNMKYRMMCRWWSMLVWKYASSYDYIMRLDDDSIIEEPITHDLFGWMAKNELVYSSNILSVDCALCNYGFKELLETMMDEMCPAKRESVAQMFKPQEIPLRAVQFHPFRSLLSITEDPLPVLGEKLRVWGMVYFFNNYFITKTAFWNRPDVKSALKYIDDSGLTFYRRLGDAPIHTAIVGLFAKPSEIRRSVFKYSKRLQREAFQGDDGEFHTYMPESYTSNGCITESTAQK